MLSSTLHPIKFISINERCNYYKLIKTCDNMVDNTLVILARILLYMNHMIYVFNHQVTKN